MTLINNVSSETILTSSDPKIELEPNSMTDGAPLKTNSESVLTNIDKLIGELEKSILPTQSKNTTTTSSMECELLIFNRTKKKFKIRGKIEEMEICLPGRFSIHIRTSFVLANKFTKYCINSTFGNKKPTVLIESCKTITTTTMGKQNKTALFYRNEQGFHKTYLQLDFFRIKTPAGEEPIIEIDFGSI